MSAVADRAARVDPVPAAAPAPRRRGAGGRLLRSRAVGWALVVLLVAAWQVSSAVDYNPTVSSPLEIWRTLVHQLTAGELLVSLLDTLRLMGIGFALAAPTGIVLGFLMGRVRVVWALLEPIVEIGRLHPTTAIIPVLILFFGIGDGMKIAVFLLSAIFPLLMTAYAGAQSVSTTLAETARTFNLGWWRTQWEIALPASAPFVLVGLRQALGASLLMSVVVGMVAGNSGIGFFILEAQQRFDIRSLLAGVVTVAAVGYVINTVFLVIERRAIRWRSTDTNRP